MKFRSKIAILDKLRKRISSSQIIRHTITTTAWSAIGKSVGFLVPFFIAAWFGVTNETDVFFFAYGVVTFLIGIFASSAESVIVPFISEIKTKDENRVGEFVSNILTLSFIGLSFLGALFLFASKPFLSVITRFSPEQISLLFRLLLEIFPLLLFLTLTSILSGVLNAYKIFWLPAISPAFRAIITIVIIYLFKDRIGVHAIAFGYIMGEFFRLLVLLGLIISKNLFPLMCSISLDPKLIEFLRTISYQAICLVAGGLNSLIDKTMASWLERGSVTILHYADRLYVIPMNLLTAGFFPVLLSYWSHNYYQSKDKKMVLQKVKNIAKLSLSISFSLFLLLAFFSKPIVYLIFARGKFPAIYIPTLRWTWICYLSGLIPYIFGAILLQAYLALKKTRFLMNLGILSGLLNIMLNYILMRFFGVIGIALSTSIVAGIIGALLFLFLSQDKEG